MRRRRAAAGRFQLRHGRLCARGLFCAAVRFCWGVLRLDYACLTFLLEGFVFGSRLLFDAERQTGRLAGGCVFCSAVGRDRHSYVLAAIWGYQTLWVHFRIVRFLQAILTGKREYEETESAARRKYVLHNPISLVMLSTGSTLGLKCGSRTAAAPDCAKEPKVEAALRPLWTLFMWGAA